MRTIEINQYGAPDVLELVDRPAPAIGEGQVRVQVAAATVNPADLWTRLGALGALHSHPFPLVLGWDLAGTVETAGEGFAKGERVAAMLQWFDEGRGAYADLVSVDAPSLARVPNGVDDVTAAALPLNGLTALQAVELLDVQPGQRVLITGASGAVGGFAVELAVARGAHVIASASFDDEDHVAGLGAQEVLGRLELADLLGAVGTVDAVLDAAPLGPELIAAVRDGGTFVGVTDPTTPAPERGITSVKVSVVPNGAQLAQLLDLVDRGQLSVRIAGTDKLENVAAVHEAGGKGAGRGKVVLTF